MCKRDRFDATAARFLGCTVRTLADWDKNGPKPPKSNRHKLWFPLVEDRSVEVMTETVNGLERPTPIPPYSCEIGAAWDLYKEIHKLDPTAYVKGAEVWLFTDHLGVGHIVWGESAAEAITRAAAWLLEEHGLKVQEKPVHAKS